MRARLVVVAVFGLLLAACASPGAAVGSSLSLPVAAGAALAEVSIYTSPDGGIYRNPDHLELRMVTRAPADALAALLPAVAGLHDLASLGGFTFVGVVVRNDGKAFSDPQLNALQIASDYAPDGTASGPLRHYYHPLFPLAVLTLHGSDASCTVHVDPGQSVVAVLVYPPIRATGSIVWGAYHDFAVRAPLGGSLPPGSYSWRAQACVPPQAAPAA
ncbi:MAG: hypothetical protein JOZ46_06495 [Candidatus Dormibacteraeota bacterium]|nr:hypothetical protein [Candidatus Dormibacteraeota bacterium]MBV9525447.1 hypothetical protein [Candidatus Dormibacteraeota bacterium]